MEKRSNCVKKSSVIILSIVVILLLAAMVAGIIMLARSGPETTGQVRDIFIIVLALESLLIGGALVILVIQLAALTNIIQNEVRPILASTKETVGTLKGTSKFLSERAVRPFIAASSTYAGFRKLIDLAGFIKKRKT